jgi:DNA-binding PadR family transcriptional regulator
LVDDPTAERYGLEIAAEAELKSGSLYPILARLEELGWVESRWEEVDPVAAGRPRRRYYRLTGSGVKHAERELHQAVQRLVLLRTLQPGTTS